MEKADGAFLTIGELAQQLGVAQHILRYWESRFPQLRPLQRAGNRRYYRPKDVAIACNIHRLLNVEGFTIKGAAKALADRVPLDGALLDREVRTGKLAPEGPSEQVTETAAVPVIPNPASGEGSSAEPLSAEAMLADFLIDRLQVIRSVLSDAVGADGSDVERGGTC